jgi:DNA-binding transcriptional LysR family regulator
VNDADQLNWDDLRFFLAAARALSLAGAARELGVEHSTVSRRLKTLERSLGGSLVLRKPEGLVLTPLGSQILVAVESVERAVARITDHAGGNQERVRLAVPSGMVKHFTAHLERLRGSSPAISLEIVSGARAVDLAKSEADLAVRVGPITDPELVARRVGAVGWALYAGPTYLDRKPLGADPTDLRGHDVIGFDSLLVDSPTGQWLEDHAREATFVMRGREMVDIASAAAGGAGVALLPCFLADDFAELVRLTPDSLVTRELALVYRREMRLSAAVRVAIDFTVNVLTSLAPLLEGTSSRGPAIR